MNILRSRFVSPCEVSYRDVIGKWKWNSNPSSPVDHNMVLTPFLPVWLRKQCLSEVHSYPRSLTLTLCDLQCSRLWRFGCLCLMNFRGVWEEKHPCCSANSSKSKILSYSSFISSSSKALLQTPLHYHVSLTSLFSNWTHESSLRISEILDSLMQHFLELVSAAPH